MDPVVLLLLVGGGVFLLFQSGILNVSVSGSAPPPNYIPPSQAVNGDQANQTEDQALNGVASGVATGLSYVPVVGKALASAFTSVYNSIMAGHIQRTKEAKDENSSLTAAVPQWDSDIHNIINAYNLGSLSAAQVKQLLDVAWQNYWKITGPHIQPGRNGCQSGSIPKSVADKQYPGMKQCSGDWGAACCVAYADLANSVNNIVAALNATEQTGKPQTASVLAVFASKYGGINRPAYTLSIRKSTAIFKL
jgi:hypothetical protein